MPWIETSWGEALDRLSIARLKASRIQDPAKKDVAQRELESLVRSTFRAGLDILPDRIAGELAELRANLDAINACLWDVEDLLRAHEAAGTTGSAEFTQLARSVYALNDRRAAAKARISALLRSRLLDVKSHDAVGTMTDANGNNGTLVLGHLGLGDQLITFPIVAALAAKGRRPVVTARRAHESTMRGLYARIADDVDFLWVDDDADVSPRFGADPERLQSVANMGYDVLLLGLHAERTHAPNAAFWTVFYEQANAISPASAKPMFRALAGPRDPAREAQVAHGPGRAYAVVHEDPSRGISLDRSVVDPALEVVTVPGRWGGERNLLDFCGLIEGAAEFHGFDSCYAWLVELMDLRGPKRYMHVYVKDDHDSVRLFAPLTNGAPVGWIDVR